ncbi:hypothetical protein L3Y34_003414 [Caenorhabditis briggsae]|uniref:Uncharacterized protein n=1 Tax=Caenorhabditis briggsae TaxID=6238 RepID=A0AAE9A666_CAEBR|nr:hypothetical protein L3Y34_003414 [Caenorhabditis briggsae]
MSSSPIINDTMTVFICVACRVAAAPTDTCEYASFYSISIVCPCGDVYDMGTYNPFTRDVAEMTRAENWPAPINYIEVSEVAVLLREEIRFKSNSKKKLDFRLFFKSLEGAREITVPNPEGIFPTIESLEDLYEFENFDEEYCVVTDIQNIDYPTELRAIPEDIVSRVQQQTREFVADVNDENKRLQYWSDLELTSSDSFDMEKCNQMALNF